MQAVRQERHIISRMPRNAMHNILKRSNIQRAITRGISQLEHNAVLPFCIVASICPKCSIPPMVMEVHVIITRWDIIAREALWSSTQTTTPDHGTRSGTFGSITTTWSLLSTTHWPLLRGVYCDSREFHHDSQAVVHLYRYRFKLALWFWSHGTILLPCMHFSAVHIDYR